MQDHPQDDEANTDNGSQNDDSPQDGAGLRMVVECIGQVGMVGSSAEHGVGQLLCRQEAAQPKEVAAAAIDIVCNLAG